MNDLSCIYRGPGARRRRNRRNSKSIEQQTPTDYILFSGKEKNLDSRSSKPTSVLSLDLSTEISDVDFSSPLATTVENTSTKCANMQENLSKIQIYRLNREMKPVSLRNPSIKGPHEEENQRLSDHVTVKRQSTSEQDQIKQSDTTDDHKNDVEKRNRPRHSSISPKRTQVNPVKVPRQSIDVSIRSQNSAPTLGKKSRRLSRQRSVSVTRTSRTRISGIDSIVHSAKPSFGRVSVMKIERKSS